MSVLRVRDLIDVAARLSPERFAAEHGPALLVGSDPRASQPTAEPRDEWSYSTGFAESDEGGGGQVGVRDMLVLPIRKAKPGAFANTILIGRAPSNDVVIATEGVSKLHARIKLSGEELQLTDAGSTNGTYVNGRPVAEDPVLLQHGDEIAFGQRTFKLHRVARFYSMLRTLPKL